MVLHLQPDGRIYVHDSKPTHPPDKLGLLSRLEEYANRIQTFPNLFVYQLSRERLWQAARRGQVASDILEFFRQHATSAIPFEVQRDVIEAMSRVGQLTLEPFRQGYVLRGDKTVIERLVTQCNRYASKRVGMGKIRSDGSLYLNAAARAILLSEAFRSGHPVEEVGTCEVQPVAPLQISLKRGYQLRDYQNEAVQAFLKGPGSGVVVLPCGAGKTVVGLGVLCAISKPTLILVPSDEAAQQWLRHLKEWTQVHDGEVGMYNASQDLFPITITTYQRLTAKTRNGVFQHLHRLIQHPVGLVIFDEVHLLPAPLFRLTAQITASHRLGLSATLVREDGKTADIYGLVGPVLYHSHAPTLMNQGFLSSVTCAEIRVALPPDEAQAYEKATAQARHRLAADNSAKFQVVQYLCQLHAQEKVLIMGHYTQFLHDIATSLGVPMLSGETSKAERLQRYDEFRRGELPVLVLSRIANAAIDLPNADVAIQISGLFGSRQEEAQRLGRLLRPKSSGANFYTLVSLHTVEEKTARHRQCFLVEQGFSYELLEISPHVMKESEGHEVT